MNKLTLDPIKQQGLFLEIESRYLEGAGIFVRPGINHVLVREEVAGLFASLETVLEQGRICNVIGSSGTGKSLATYSFACMILDRGFIITWVHLYQRQEHKYVRFVNGEKTNGVLDDIKELNSFLSASTIGQKHLLILDGVTLDHTDADKLSHKWLRKDLPNRRLVHVSSMASGRRFSADEKRDNKYFEVKFFSWRLADYLEAIKNPGFLAQIESMLDAHIPPSELPGAVGSKREAPDISLSAESKLESKFHFAGGSSRAMFDMTTDQIVSEVSDDVQRPTHLFGYLSGEISECSDKTVNRLLSWHIDSSSLLRCTPVSAFASSAIAIKLGPQMVSNLRKVLQNEANPSMDGILLEMWIFAKLRVSNLKFKEKCDGTWIDRERNGTRVIYFNPLTRMPPISPSEDTWLKPTRWQQGGYDAVQINLSEKRIIFLQITRSASHSFLTDYFANLLNQIKYVWCQEIRYLAIYFVVPTNRGATFKIAIPSTSGLFSDYFVFGDAANAKWEKGSELSHVKICCVDDEQQ